jgi:hypothetical protein
MDNIAGPPDVLRKGHELQPLKPCSRASRPNSRIQAASRFCMARRSLVYRPLLKRPLAEPEGAPPRPPWIWHRAPVLSAGFWQGVPRLVFAPQRRPGQSGPKRHSSDESDLGVIMVPSMGLLKSGTIVPQYELLSRVICWRKSGVPLPNYLNIDRPIVGSSACVATRNTPFRRNVTPPNFAANRLLMFMLKGRRPATFRDNASIEHSG